MPRCLMLLTACVLALSACGKQAPSGPKLGSVERPTAPVASPQPAAPPAAPGTTEAAAQALIQQAKAAFSAMASYHMQISYFQAKDADTVNGVYDILGTQPRNLLIEIKKGNDVGTKVLWRGGNEAQVRPSGFLSAITVNLSLTDKRLVSMRGYTLAETDLSAMFGYMQNASNHAVLADAADVSITGPKLLADTQTMSVRFNTQSKLPMSVDFRDASQKLVYHLSIDSLQRRSSTALDI